MAADLIDISQPLRAGMPHWPSDTPFETAPVWQIGPDCPVSVARFGCSTHAGTHADAPSHYDRTGLAIDALDLDPFLGPAIVIDARDFGPVITSERLAPALPSGATRILLRTWDRFPHDEWRDDFTTLHPDAVALLAERGTRLVGVDTPSIDPREAKLLRAHDAARVAGLRILEGLVLDHVAPGEYELIALPLRLVGLDASPVRAVLRPLAA